MTPLQKARRALQIALKKAVQNVYSQDSTKQFYQAEFDGKLFCILAFINKCSCTNDRKT